MRDITIKGKWVKRELIIIVSIYLLANLLNLISIFIYKTDWKELYSSQLFVLYLTEWLYILSIAARLIYFGFRYILKRR